MSRTQNFYRGKSVQTGEWIFGFYIELNGSSFIGKVNENNFGWITSENINWIEVEPNTVGQFVGKYDLSGEPIFEHDLLRFRRETFGWSRGGTYKTDVVGQVYWDSENACFEVTNRHEPSNIEVRDVGKMPKEVFDKCNIIGNIFDRREEGKSTVDITVCFDELPDLETAF